MCILVGGRRLLFPFGLVLVMCSKLRLLSVFTCGPRYTLWSIILMHLIGSVLTNKGYNNAFRFRFRFNSMGQFHVQDSNETTTILAFFKWTYTYPVAFWDVVTVLQITSSKLHCQTEVIIKDKSYHVSTAFLWMYDWNLELILPLHKSPQVTWVSFFG